jgi:hypothetical protein
MIRQDQLTTLWCASLGAESCRCRCTRAREHTGAQVTIATPNSSAPGVASGTSGGCRSVGWRSIPTPSAVSGLGRYRTDNRFNAFDHEG